MPCCSSCSLSVQGHQLPTGARCSFLFDKESHTSGLKPECTVCLQHWGSHSQGKHIPKYCRFCQQQASGDTATDGDVHSRLACIAQENHVIKAQLSQLTELVWQLLPQPGQATPQPADAGNMFAVPPPAEEQATGTLGVNLDLPLPSWSHPRDTASGVPLGGPPATAT